MKAVWKDEVLAEAKKDDLIYIEGNWYFPPNSLNREYFEISENHTTCPWRGEADYFNLVVDKDRNNDAAWYYAAPNKSAIKRVKKDFTNYAAFWRGVEISD